MLNVRGEGGALERGLQQCTACTYSKENKKKSETRWGKQKKKVSFNWTVKLPLIVRRVSAAGAQIDWAIAGALAPSIIPPHFVTVSNFKCMKCLSKQVSRRNCANLFQTGQLSMTGGGGRVDEGCPSGTRKAEQFNYTIVSLPPTIRAIEINQHLGS